MKTSSPSHFPLIHSPHTQHSFFIVLKNSANNSIRFYPWPFFNPQVPYSFPPSFPGNEYALLLFPINHLNQQSATLSPKSPHSFRSRLEKSDLNSSSIRFSFRFQKTNVASPVDSPPTLAKVPIATSAFLLKFKSGHSQTFARLRSNLSLISIQHSAFCIHHLLLSALYSLISVLNS